MRISEFDFELPEALIAQRPAEPREAARLLVLPRAGGRTDRGTVAELPERLPPRSLLVVNDTRVIASRVFAEKPSGGRVELFVLGLGGAGEQVTCLARSSKPLRAGTVLAVRDREGGPSGFRAEVTWREREEARVRFDAPVAEVLARAGHVPLPPYIRRQDDAGDRERYQTVFAAHDGAVAAPTAGLHFTGALLSRIEAAGHAVARITLHVGLGTFAPVRVEDLDEHVMHEECFSVPAQTADAISLARAEGRAVVAVGTTVVRCLESAWEETTVGVRAGEGATRLFIQPGFRFRAVDALVTNFHLPRSTLLVMVSAFAGRERVLAAYDEAVREGFRFFSYGDAMLIS